MKTFLLRLLFPMLLAPAALAQELAPDALVKKISDEVIAAIRQDRAIQAGDPRKIHDLVDAKVLPHFNFKRTTRIAMGQSWKRATPEQQEQLVSQFKLLLVRTYSGALASYRDQVIEFRPLRAKPADTEVTVRSVVKQGGTPPIAIDYDLEKTDSGWKIFDVRVDGISLAANYRSVFAEEIRNNGIDGLISVLAGKNGKSGSGTYKSEPGKIGA
jgi:phospholipid transport system substrate-binding protein